MMFLITVFYVLSLARIVDPTTIEISCEDSDLRNEVRCHFTEAGTYILKYVDASVTSVWFNKLTNSYVLLPNQIRKLVISSSTFDDIMGCDHVISRKIVEVYIEDINFKRICQPALSTDGSDTTLPMSSTHFQQPALSTDGSDTTLPMSSTHFQQSALSTEGSDTTLPRSSTHHSDSGDDRTTNPTIIHDNTSTDVSSSEDYITGMVAACAVMVVGCVFSVLNDITQKCLSMFETYLIQKLYHSKLVKQVVKVITKTRQRLNNGKLMKHVVNIFTRTHQRRYPVRNRRQTVFYNTN